MTDTSTIDSQEAMHFGALAADWWDPKGSSAMLHRLNPVRLRYLRERIDRHWGGDVAARRPLAGKRALDMGCGAGLLTEPLARLGAAATGLDAAPENIAVAKRHAEAQGLAIDYRAGGIDSLFPGPGVSSEGGTRSGGGTSLDYARDSGDRFDLVVSFEVIEHVADPAGFVAGLAAALAPGGLLVLSTPNRTALSRVAMVTFGEGLGAIPRGTHDWGKFLTPEELAALVADAGLAVEDVTGLAFSPTRGFALSDNKALNYFLTATLR